MKNRFGQEYFVEFCKRIAGVESGPVPANIDRGFYSKRSCKK